MCSAKSFQLFAKVAMCPPRGSISKIAMLLCVITVRQHSSIAILLMDPRGIRQQNSNAAVCDHCQATQQHCYFADGPSRDMSTYVHVVVYFILRKLFLCAQWALGRSRMLGCTGNPHGGGGVGETWLALSNPVGHQQAARV